MTAPLSQNPHACSDSGCVLLMRDTPIGMRTNGGCKCLRLHRGDHDERRRVRAGIDWLRAELERARS